MGTLAIAKNLNPRSVLGIDIDENLIRAAKQNVKHYTSCIMPKQTPKYSASGAGIHTGQTPLNTPLYSGSCTTPSRTPSYPGWDTIENVCVLQPNITSAEEENSVPSKQPDKNDLFPICMPILFGPIDPTNPTLIPGSVRDSEHANRDVQCSGGQGSIASSTALAFPQNVRFACSNYVLESDDLLDAIQPEYDTILCLSTTKWMHLNFGDEGIKRAFKRMYAQLRPNGVLILEPQGLASYSKKAKKINAVTKENFKTMKFFPNHFVDFLINQVGFTGGDVLAVPEHSALGFRRPIHVFRKP